MALMHAAEQGHADCVRVLIDAGADMEVKGGVRRWSLRGRDTLLYCFLFLRISLLCVIRLPHFPICRTESMTFPVLHFSVPINVLLVSSVFSLFAQVLKSSSHTN